MESSKRIKSNLTTPKTILDLPTDALLLILSRLDQKDIRSVSLVCKPFLDLSNHFICKLTFNTLLSARSFREIFTRFSYVNQITLNTKRVAHALMAISKSQLNLEALKINSWPTYPELNRMLSLSGKLKTKSLAFGWFSKFNADQVVEFIRLFPSLEELYFGRHYEWDDALIESITLMLPNLRKINLSSNRCLTDNALYALSTNCVNLEHIGIDGCYKFTPDGFCTFLLRCRKLKYLDLPSFSLYPSSDLLLAETISACENVHHLSVDYPLIRDATLGIIAKSRASLTSFGMKNFYLQPNNIDYTMTGLSAMLCAFQGLTRLDICLPLPESDKFLDQKMSELVKSLPCLTGISITCYCPIYATLFSLIENCPLTECIYLNNISALDRRCKVTVPPLIRKNYNVKYIRLIPSLDASFMIALASFCPCLKKNWDGDFPSGAFFPNNPAVYWTKQISSC